MTTTDAAGSLSGRLAGQGALLFAGFAGAQVCSFLRNALLGHWLAKGDFGIAATLTLTLTLIEILSDLGADRLIVQDRDGEDERLMATAHVLLVARGLLLAIGLYAGAGAVAHFFGVPQAAWAFQAVALAPLLKGAMHLDLRRRQRRLDNRPYIAVEAVPQVLALAATPVALWLAPGYAAVVWLALGQAAAAVVLSHLLAERRYRLGVDREFALRLVSFGWPILLSGGGLPW